MAGFKAIGGIFWPNIERYIICAVKCIFVWKSLIGACWPNKPPPSPLLKDKEGWPCGRRRGGPQPAAISCYSVVTLLSTRLARKVNSSSQGSNLSHSRSQLVLLQRSSCLASEVSLFLHIGQLALPQRSTCHTADVNSPHQRLTGLVTEVDSSHHAR